MLRPKVRGSTRFGHSVTIGRYVRVCAARLGGLMPRTEKLRPAMMEDQGRGNGPLFIAAALVAMGIAYVLLLAHPGLVHGVSAVWQRIPTSGSAPGWALPAVAAGVAIGGTAIGVALLSAFVRGVQMHPFAWLAPVLVGFSSMVMTGLPIDLPWQALSVRLFSVLAGLVMLGGGAVMQMRGLTSIVAGTLLLLLPMLVLLAGYAAMPAGLPAVLSGLDSSSQLYLFVLALTSVGIGFMAFVTERNSQDAALLASQLSDQNVTEALEFAEAADARATQAERRAQVAEQRLRAAGAGSWGAPPIAEDEVAAFAAVARPGLSTMAVVAGVFCVVAVVVAGLYAGVYRPLERRAEAQRKFVASAAAEHAAEIDGLRKHFQAQQASLEAVIAAERAKAGEAQAATAQPPAPEQPGEAAAAAAASTAKPPEQPNKKAATPALAPEPPSQPATPVPAPAPAKAAPAEPEKERAVAPRRTSARKSAAFRRAPRKAEISRAGAAATAKAVAEPEEPELDRETRRALRESIDDDPIGGLE
jgi:hypothetical protein